MRPSAARLPARLRPSAASRIPRRTFTATRGRCAEEARVVEVGPRDGLQNEKNTVKLETKIELIRRLAGTGLRDIEAGSFVAPKWVPQMANSAEVMNYILGHPPTATHHINYNFLVPNLRGLENYLKVVEASAQPSGPSQKEGTGIQGGENKDTPAPNTSTQNPNDMPSRQPWQEEDNNSGSGQRKEVTEESTPNTSPQNPNELPSGNPAISSSSSSSTSSTPRSSPTSSRRSSASSVSSTDTNVHSPFATEISVFAAATDAFSQANTNCTVSESLARFKPILALTKSKNIRVRGYVSVALGCPYEGPDVDPRAVAAVTTSLLEMGADEVSVADTTGMGTAPRTEKLLQALAAAGIAPHDLALHFHDTYGQALVNTVVGLEHGVRVFDASVAGLGGCPYSKGATGNVATEDLVYCLHSLGVQTGVDVQRLAEIGEWISRELGRPNGTRAGKAVLARLRSS